MKVAPGSRVRFRDGSGEAIVQRVFLQHEAVHLMRLPSPTTDTFARRRQFVQFRKLEVYNPETKLYVGITRE